jgi:cobyrinic acid a,c-diamide synthase
MGSSRLVIAGLSGDSGKTIASLSISTALRRKGYSVSAFKKGPDYIDPAWLSLVSHSVCRSLDTYLVDPDEVVRNFRRCVSSCVFSLSSSVIVDSSIPHEQTYLNP